MKAQRGTKVLVLILVAIMLLAVGYAAITKSLNITGSASADVYDENFKVEFTNATSSSTPANGNSTIVTDQSYSGTSGTLSVTGMTAVGDKANFIFTVTNKSTDLTAYIQTITVTNGNEAYFKVETSGGEGEELAAGDSTEITVTVTCLKTIADREQTASITISFNATTSQGSGGTGTEISSTTSYVGYYADIDGDEEPDGIIYADLVAGQINTTGLGESYSWDKISSTDAKTYTVSDDMYTEGPFEDNYVITLADGSTGEDRFYIMALEDASTSEFCWYKNATYNSNLSLITSTDFGTGKANTATMLSAWKAGTYGTGESTDMWSLVEDGSDWFVPSRDEWAAFAGELEITSNNYSSFGLSNYWSSSQSIDYEWNYRAYYAYFSAACIGTSYGLNILFGVRFSIIF